MGRETVSHKKSGLDRFSRLDVYWIQINKQKSKAYLQIIERKQLCTRETLAADDFYKNRNKIKDAKNHAC